MNLRRLSGFPLEEALGAKLKALLGGIGWLRHWTVEHAGPTDPAFDLLATIPLPAGGKAALCIECKGELRPSVFPQVAERTFAPPGRPKVIVPVLGLPWVSPRVAELCAEHGWSWFDLAGNYRIDVPGVFRLESTGHPSVHAVPRPAANLATREAGRIVRALLAPENAARRWTQRHMQEECQPGVSLGLVNKVVRHLRDEAFIEPAQDGGFRLRDPYKLLLAWRDVYRFDRQERRGYFTLFQGRKLRDALAHLGLEAGGFAAYASFSAAEYQAPHVRQPKTWLHVHAREIARFERLLETQPGEAGANLTVLIPEDDGVFYLGDGGTMGDHRLVCTNVVQTYVDLSHSGGRGAEAAEALLEQRLRPEWRLQGLKA